MAEVVWSAEQKTMISFTQYIARILTIWLALAQLACSEGPDRFPAPPIPPATSVYANSEWEVLVEEDIIYGYGLSHESWNSAEDTTLPLKLDLYRPDDQSTAKRPVILFIHGGGFRGGSKQQAQIVQLADYYASRGWVFVSIDYRLADDRGTVPQEWIDHAQTLPTERAQQFLAMYPAHRDARAALRWISAHQSMYGLDMDHLTVGGGSAGAIIAVSMGISEEVDFLQEISIINDPTLNSTHIGQSYTVHSIIDLWGSDAGLDALEEGHGHQRFDANDPPLMILHGTNDSTVLFSEATDLKSRYDGLQLPYAWYPIQGAGHGLWGAQVDGKGLDQLIFDFITTQQGLLVE